VAISNAMFSLNRRGADVALRPGSRPPENLIGRCVGRLPSALYAARAYLWQHRRRGPGREEPDWTQHRWVGFDASLAHLPQARWMEAQVPRERVLCRIDSLLAMVDAVRHCTGLGILLVHLAARVPSLVALAPPAAEFDSELWLLTHSDFRSSARVRAFIDFIATQLAADPAVLAPQRGRRRSD
jgi:DNA-binding transcriptional LysR family regulator